MGDKQNKQNLKVCYIQKRIKNEKLILFALSKLTPFSLQIDFKRPAVGVMELPNKTEGTFKNWFK